MKHPLYTALAVLTCAWLAASNMRGWSLFQGGVNRSVLNSTAYRYRPAIHTSGGWFSGSGFHK